MLALLISVALSFHSTANAQAQAREQLPLATVTLVNASTHDELIVGCLSAAHFSECKTASVFLRHRNADGTMSPLEELASIDIVSMQDAAKRMKVKDLSLRASVLPGEPNNPFEQEATDVPGYFFNIAQGVWEWAGDTDEAVGYAGAVAATPLAIAADAVALVAIDGGYVISFPVRAFVKAHFGRGRKALRGFRFLMKLNENSKKKISSRAFDLVKFAVQLKLDAAGWANKP